MRILYFPDFYPEGNSPVIGDTLHRTTVKILGALTGSGGGGTYATGGNFSGVGSPEGVVTASPGAIYTDTNTTEQWNKITGTGNTGWVLKA